MTPKLPLPTLAILAVLAAGCASPAPAPDAGEEPLSAAPRNPASPVPAPKEDKTVYKGAEFGMTFDQVARLPQFKDWIEDENTPYICKFDENIDSKQYRVTFFFHRDTLYRADFSSAHDLYRSAGHLETDIRAEVENFRDFITRAYGKPTTDNGIPRLPSAMAPGRISIAYRWISGDKRIELGISESRAGKEYKMVAQIYHEPTDRAIRTGKSE